MKGEVIAQPSRQEPEGAVPRIASFGFLASSFCLFTVLATLNSAGYRYGASDQAFYVPAVLLREDPALFPRDRPVLTAQADLTGFDEVGAALARVTRAPLPLLLLALYVLTLVLLAHGARRLGSTVYRDTRTWLALAAALTLRHAITRSGTNTLEGYFHPRQLAFALGVLALGSFLRGGLTAPVLLVAAAGVLHPTTALWFAVWLGVAAFVSERRLRGVVAAAAVCGAIAAVWALTAGPLADRLVAMDAAWLETLASKDYLFPLRWAAGVWAINLLYVPIVICGYVLRRRAGLVSPRETGLAAGCLSLLLLFFACLALQATGLALAFQLQPARMFWMLDLMATVYVIWMIAEGSARATARRALVTAIVIAALSLARGLYLKLVLFPDRPLVQAGIQDDDWGRVMRWARQTDRASGWLADPTHASIYGSSVRVAGERDVLVEAVKDGAIGMYDRGVALRVRERVEAVGDFAALTAPRARELAATYDLDYLVTERALDLPVAFRSGALVVYRLR
jgi:hypothetical protein